MLFLQLCAAYWFKSGSSNFAEWVDFAYWLSCIGKGLRLQPAQQVGLFINFITCFTLEFVWPLLKVDVKIIFFKVIVCCVLLQMETNNLGKHLVKSYLSTYFTLVPGCLFYSVWQIISTRVTKLKRPRPF